MHTHTTSETIMTRSCSNPLLLVMVVIALSACQDRRTDKAYLRGDYGKSAEELQSLANLGEARAQYDLALLYDKGLGVPQSDAEALRGYQRAAEHGERRAQCNLGLMYMNGQGTPPNLVHAYFWLSLSLAKGDTNAPAAREYLIEKMTPEQIEEAKNLVRKRLIEGEHSASPVRQDLP